MNLPAFSVQCALTVNGESSRNSSSPLRKDWVARVTRLQEELVAWPANTLARCELAATLEKLERYEDALGHWKVVLESDPNSLKAREGVVRCRQQTGRPRQSNL